MIRQLLKTRSRSARRAVLGAVLTIAACRAGEEARPAAFPDTEPRQEGAAQPGVDGRDGRTAHVERSAIQHRYYYVPGVEPVALLAAGDSSAPAPASVLLLRDGGCGPALPVSGVSRGSLSEDYVPLRRALVLEEHAHAAAYIGPGALGVSDIDCPLQVAREEWQEDDSRRLRLVEESMTAAGDWIRRTFAGPVNVAKGWGSRWHLDDATTLSWVLVDLDAPHDDQRLALVTEKSGADPPQFRLGLRLSVWDEFRPLAVMRSAEGYPLTLIVQSTRIPGGTAYALTIARPSNGGLWSLDDQGPFLHVMVGHD